MFPRPKLFPEWAKDDQQEIFNIGTPPATVILNNKLEPSLQYKNSGENYQEPLPAEYINFQFDLIDDWVKHLDNRFIIGDLHTTGTGETPEELSERLGGEWLQVGTQTFNSVEYRVFEKQS